MLLIRHTITRLLVPWCWHYQLASALLLLFWLPQSQQLQMQQGPKHQHQQFAATQSQLTSAIENNGTLAQALVHMYAMQQAQNGAISGNPVNGASNGTSQPNSNQFVIKLIHNDTKNNLAYVSIVPLNYTNLHEPRLELRYQSKNPFVSIDETTSNNTVVAAVVVNDEDSGPNGETNLSIEHGNELGHFKLVSTQFTNTIQVNGAPLSRALVPEYNLTIVARDHGSPPKSSAVNLVIKLNKSSFTTLDGQGGVPAPTFNPKQPVPDLMYVGVMLVFIFSALILIIIIACALVHKPKSKKGPPPRTSSATNSRMHPSDHCLCFGLTDL